MTDKKRCFVIMPFSKTQNHTKEYWTRHFTSYLKPLIEKIKGIEPFRSEPLRGNIASQIITNLVNSEIVVADLTDHNPNVLWELGVRQSYKHCTITIAEVGTLIPFHFSHKGILFYNADHLANEEFEEKFLDSIRDCLEHPNEPDSPVLETLGGRGTLYSIVHNDENKRRINALKKEFQRNEEIFESIYKYCEDNKNMRSGAKTGTPVMESQYLKTSTAEFLLVNRYLDKEKEFYDVLDLYRDDILAINGRLQNWGEYPENVEDWLMKNKINTTNYWKKIKEYLKELE